MSCFVYCILCIVLCSTSMYYMLYIVYILRKENPHVHTEYSSSSVWRVSGQVPPRRSCCFPFVAVYLSCFSLLSVVEINTNRYLPSYPISRHGFKETSCALQFGVLTLLYKYINICKHSIKISQCPTLWHTSYVY